MPIGHFRYSFAQCLMFCTMPIVLQPAFFLSEGKVLLTGKSSLLNLYEKKLILAKIQSWWFNQMHRWSTQMDPRPSQSSPCSRFFLFVHAIGAISNAKSSVGILQSPQFLMVGWALCSCRATKLNFLLPTIRGRTNNPQVSRASAKIRSQFDAKPNQIISACQLKESISRITNKQFIQSNNCTSKSKIKDYFLKTWEKSRPHF